MMTVEGVIKKGLGVAIRTTQAQATFFFELGLPLADQLQKGTINISIAPHAFVVLSRDYFYEGIAWQEGGKEDFGFITIKEISYKGRRYQNPGYIYIPYNSPHLGNTHQLEVVAIPIEGVEMDQSIAITLEDGKLSIS